MAISVPTPNVTDGMLLSPEAPVSKLAGLTRLALIMLSVAMIWGVMLPWLAGRPRIAAQLQWLDDQGVDPSAMYYTELDVMKPILQRLYARDAEPR